jgi:O-antigen ligase
MTSISYTDLSRGQRWLLAGLVVAPLAVLMAARFLGLMPLVQLGAIGVAGVAFLVTVFVRPRWGIYFMAFYVYSALFFYVPGVLSVAVVATLVLAAALELFAGERDRMTDRVFVGFAAVLLMCSLSSTLVAHDPERSLLALVAMVKVLLLTVLIVHFLRTPDDLRGLVVAVFVGAIATIIFGVINLKLGIYETDDVIGGAELYRFAGAHADPNEAAGYMCAAIPLGVFLIRHARGRWPRMLSVVGVIVLIAGMFATLSRSAVIPFALVAVAVVGREVRSRGGYLVILALLVLGILLSPGYYWVRLAELQKTMTSNVNQDFSVMLRLSAARTAWDLFLQNPWWGIGLDNFVVRGATGVIRRIVVHNTHLEILVSLGVFGFAAFAGVFASGLRHCVRGVRDRTLSPEMRSLSYYLGVSLLSMLTTAFFLTIHARHNLWIPLAATLVLGNLLPRRAARG